MNSRLIFLILSICTFTLISTPLLSLPNTTLPPDCKRCTSLKNKLKKNSEGRKYSWFPPPGILHSLRTIVEQWWYM